MYNLSRVVLQSINSIGWVSHDNGSTCLFGSTILGGPLAKVGVRNRVHIPWYLHKTRFKRKPHTPKTRGLHTKLSWTAKVKPNALKLAVTPHLNEPPFLLV